MDKARRYTTGKLRIELIPAEFKEALAKVYTIGAEKYTVKDEQGNVIDDGADNWRKGLSWRQTLGSIHRHLNKFEKGEDYDYDYPKELLDKYGPTLHLANAAWGLASLISFYKIAPQFDDRFVNTTKKIGLDIDEVICDWVGPWCERFKLQRPKTWFFQRNIMQHFQEMREKNELDDFYLSLKPLVSPCDIPFEPHCYVTSRPVSTEITEKWLDMHGFPTKPVITVEPGTSKVEALKQAGVEVFVDDSFDNYKEVNGAGILCYLMDAPHNQRYDVGYRRIKSLKELV